MRVLLSVYHWLAYYLSFALFGLFGLLLNLGSLVLGWLPATARAERFFQRLIHQHFRLWFRWLSFARIVLVRFTGRPAAAAGRGAVVVANHPGLMDATYLLARFPHAVCVFKPAIRRNPVLGAAARRAGYVASDAGHDSLRAAAGKVAAGHVLIMFPEGTRSRGDTLLPFKPGFALVARIAQAPVQLVRITSEAPLLAKGLPWWRIPPLPVQVTVAFGPALPPPTPAQKTREFVAEVERWFREPVGRPATTPASTRVPVLAVSGQPEASHWQTVP